ncbi:hypothetical protein AB0M46_00020 [Dactylosporangium sp. NPDC051485]|uniref:DUF4304 domain-containing protein n=1 Tax=Dactylosporangium sp. NPDC051485 TaxID=3154846 RepID=UPI003437B540
MSVDVRVAYQEMLASIVVPLLVERGFAEARGRHLWVAGNGDAISLWFQGSQPTFPGQVAFFVNVDAATGRWVEYRRREDPDADVAALLGQVYGRVRPGDGYAFHRGSDDWNLRQADAAPEYGAEVRRMLDDVVLPGLERHLALNATLERAIAGGAVQSAFERPPELPGVINRMSYLEQDDGYVQWLRRAGF